MTKRQLNIMLCGIALVVLALLFPPWRFKAIGSSLQTERAGPYSFVFSPPDAPNPSAYWNASIDFPRLLLPIGAIVLTTVGLILAFKEKKSGEVRQWFYSVDGNEKVGPITKAEVKDLIVNGTLDEGSLVWSPALPDWKLVKQIDELAPLLSAPTPQMLPVTVRQTNSSQLSASKDVPKIYFWRRFSARCIDLLFVMPIAIAVFLPMEWTVYFFLPSDMSSDFVLMFFIMTLISHLALVIGFCLNDTLLITLVGTTLGKAMMGIKVRDANGGNLGFAQVFVRTERLMFSMAYLLFFPFLTVFFMTYAFGKERGGEKSAWDKSASTNLQFSEIGFVRYAVGVTLGLLLIASYYVLNSAAKIHFKSEVTKQVERTENYQLLER